MPYGLVLLAGFDRDSVCCTVGDAGLPRHPVDLVGR